MTEPAIVPVIVARAGRAEDIPFLARIIEIASTPPFPQSPLRQVLDPVDTPTLPFLEVVLAEDAFAWGLIADFVVLTVDGNPAAACAVFVPDAGNRHPLRMDRMPAVAARLGWDDARLQAFRAAYDCVHRFKMNGRSNPN
ncbi:MAG: hypothetical protein EA405_12005 [Rhodospirillales bacterium]|nr:MAG: hypothetical protein EA405_12005 [Rhodospirillales bacterium]